MVPGFIDTPINAKFLNEYPKDAEAMGQTVPVRRAGHAEEIAPMDLWLCTDKTSHCNGGYYYVDGGWMSV